MATDRLDIAAHTDAGLQRSQNEDTFLIAELATGTRHGPGAYRGKLDGGAGVALAVIDACGNGFRAAGTAPELAAEAMRRELVGSAESSKLPAALRAASAAIFAEIGDDPTREQQASATLMVVADGELQLAHIGGTRAYRLRRGRLEKLTRDDTLANDEELSAAMRASGFHGDRALVPTKWLGRGNPAIGDAVMTLPVESGDVLLLSSMGLHLVVDETVIQRLLVEHARPAAACDALYEAAMAAGGTFNVTIVVARVAASADAGGS